MKNAKGFTLIEILAVLVILGVIAAIAVPRYINVAAQAKISAAQAEAVEMKTTLKMAYAKLFMSSGIKPANTADVIISAGFTPGTPADVGQAPDIWNVTLRAVSTGVATITVNSRAGDRDYQAVGTWILP